jgi:hypothetical protein
LRSHPDSLGQKPKKVNEIQFSVKRYGLSGRFHFQTLSDLFKMVSSDSGISKPLKQTYNKTLDAREGMAIIP